MQVMQAGGDKRRISDIAKAGRRSPRLAYSGKSLLGVSFYTEKKYSFNVLFKINTEIKDLGFIFILSFEYA